VSNEEKVGRPVNERAAILMVKILGLVAAEEEALQSRKRLPLPMSFIRDGRCRSVNASRHVR
jgi:hypothetical protein